MQLYVWFDHVTSCVTLGKLLISLLQFLYLKFQMGIIIVPTWYHSIPGIGPGALQILYAGYFLLPFYEYMICVSNTTVVQRHRNRRMNHSGSTELAHCLTDLLGCRLDVVTLEMKPSHKRIPFCGSILYLQLTRKHPKEDATIWRQLSSFPLWEKIVSLGSPLPYP